MASKAGAGMRIYRNVNVLDAARERMRFLFREFPNVVVSTSGGKDSTVVLELALEAARELDRLPVNVVFLDQEAEWQCVIDYMRNIMTRPEVTPYWYQVPFRMSNSTSAVEQWLYAWDPAAKDRWMHPQEPYAITENNTGADRFHEMFRAILKHHWPDTKTCYVTGLRGEESPNRLLGVTHHPAYKWATWGAVSDSKIGHYTMHPIYDWTLGDVWHAIQSHGWRYCTLYDELYRYGMQDRKMRVSNVHHETAVQSLFYLQEIEPKTWERLTQRLEGIDMAGKLGQDYFITDLPAMFSSWREYRDYLLEHLVGVEAWREKLRRRFASMDEQWRSKLSRPDDLARIQITAVMVNDHEFVTLGNWEHAPEQMMIRRGEVSWA